MKVANRPIVTLGMVFATTCVFTARSYALPIGVDNRNGFTSGSLMGSGDEFDGFRDTIVDVGHTPVQLTTFLGPDLAGLRLVFLKQPFDLGFSAQEIAAIQEFISAGGAAVIMAEGGVGSNIDNINALASHYGVVFADAPAQPIGHTVVGFVDHPITDDVASVGVDYQRRLTQIVPPAIDLTLGNGADDVLAVVNPSAHGGMVVFISDTTLWKDGDVSNADRTLGFGDNKPLLENILRFAAPEPATIALLGMAFLCVGRRSPRRRS